VLYSLEISLHPVYELHGKLPLSVRRLKSIHGTDRYKEIVPEQLFEPYPEEIARGLEDEPMFDLQRIAEDTAREEHHYDEGTDHPSKTT
jgi:hypothetical protein